MLEDFLHVYKAIKVVINSSKLKAFKNKSLILIDIELNYLRNILNILIIFIKVTTKLQAKNYPIIYYIILEIYKIYNRLKGFKETFQVSKNKNKNKN
jgi:Na+-translocating ferredoxin:NAD+ oxidoreductase RnfA subunit